MSIIMSVEIAHASSLWFFSLISAHGGKSKCKSLSILHMVVRIWRVKAIGVNSLYYLSATLFRDGLPPFLLTHLCFVLVFLAFNCCLSMEFVSLSSFFGMASHFVNALLDYLIIHFTPFSKWLAPIYPKQQKSS